MMLTQKPTSAFRPHPQHRRMPSAPPLAVQPTKTPGLLTLARVQVQPKKIQKSFKRPYLSKKAAEQQQPAFPVCDDVSEMGGDTPRLATRALPLPSSVSMPVMPAPRQRRSKNGRPVPAIVPFPAFDDIPAPKSAPLASTPFFSPFPSPPPRQSPKPSPKKNTRKRERKHQRTPSEGGLFHLSGASSTEDSDVDFQDQSTDELQVLLAKIQLTSSISTPSTPTRSTPTRSATTSPRAARPRPTSTPILPGTSSSAPLPGISSSGSSNRRAVAFKFAGSGFQNSPSPDELPDPGEL